MNGDLITTPTRQFDLVGGQEGEPSQQHDADVLAAARAYIDKVPPAVSGEGGSNTTFHVVCLLADKFELEPEEAWLVLAEFNLRCEPPWTKVELVHKLVGAYMTVGVELCEEELNAELNAHFELPEIPTPSTTLPQSTVGQPSAGSGVSGLNLSGNAPVPGIRAKPSLDGIRPVTDDEMLELSALRKIDVRGIKLAADKGFLIAITWHGQRCYGLTDRSRRLVEVRRLDGKPFPAVAEYGLAERKSHAIKHSNTEWPLGIIEAGTFSHIALVEGIPDFLYAHWRLVMENAGDRVAVVGMLSAAPSIDEAACFSFAEKSVRIFPHMDRAGVKAAKRWQRQLMECGAAEVDIFDLSDLKQIDGTPGGAGKSR